MHKCTKLPKNHLYFLTCRIAQTILTNLGFLVMIITDAQAVAQLKKKTKNTNIE